MIKPTSRLGFDRTILRQMDERMVARGQGYVGSGRITDVDIAADGKRIQAKVKGTDPIPYDVDINIVDGQRGPMLKAYCACPVGRDCKHAAAVLLTVLSGMPTGTTSMAGSVPRTSDGDLSFWLAQVGKAATVVTDPSSDAPPAEILRYVLDFTDEDGRTAYVTAITARPGAGRKPGLVQGRRFALRSLAESRVAMVTAADRTTGYIVNSLWRSELFLGTVAATPLDHAELCTSLLPHLLETGRLHWKSINGPVVTGGPPRPAGLEWRALPDGRQLPHVALGDDSGAEPVSRDGLWYVDAAKAQIGALVPPMPVPVFHSLLRAPALDPTAAALARARLQPLLHLLDPQEKAALPRTEIVLHSDDTPPVARLRIGLFNRSDPYLSRNQPPTELAVLTFAYGPEIVTPQQGPALFRQIDGPRVTVRQRRTDVEEAALQRLTSLGLAASRGSWVPRHKAAKPLPGLHLEAHGRKGDVWLDVMTRLVPKLRADGWQVEVDADFPWQAELADTWDGQVADAGNGWFDLDLGIQVGGQRVPLLPLLLRALSMGWKIEELTQADPDANLFTNLPDGRFVAIPVARLAPLSGVLLELFAGIGTTDVAGRARIGLGQVALLDGMPGLPDLLRPDRRQALARLLEPVAEADPPPGLLTDLRPYQRRGLGWLQALDEAEVGGVLADDMGLGKTLQIIALLLARKQAGGLSKPALVVAPTSVVPNWAREVARHAPSLSVHIHQGLDRAKRWPPPPGTDIVVTSYALLPRDQGILAGRPWSLLILDEAQAVKNQAAKTASIVRDIPAERRFCVTGTPLENHLGELWTQMDFVMPGLLGDARTFNKLFRTPVEKKGDRLRHQMLAARVRPFLLRRAKAEVASDLPPKTEIIERIPLADDQRDLYEALRLAMDGKVRQAIAAQGLGRSHIIILEALLRLRQACCDPALIGTDSARKVAGSAKRTHLMQMLEDLVQEGRRILIFSQFTTMLDLIAADLDRAGMGYVTLTGQTKNRMAPVDRFQAGEVPIFLISLKAGGTGLTLTAADTVIHYDPWWNPAVEDQATDRAHRIGQDKPVFVYKLVADGTVEDRMLDMQARKRGLATGIYEAGADAPAALTETDIDRLFAPLG